MNIIEVKKNSIKIDGTVVSVYPQFNWEEHIDMTDIRSEFNGCYSTNNSVICFVVDGEVYVTPITDAVTEAIKSAGLRKARFYVPFSNWDYPKFQKGAWESLWSLAHAEWSREYERDAAKFCDKNGLRLDLPEEVLAKCFKMPPDGVQVEWQGEQSTYFPVGGSERFFCGEVVKKIGKCCSNNSCTVFVHRDGHTYVSNGRGVSKELEAAGYREEGLFVPFSNGEQIIDYALARRWDAIKK